MHAHFSGRLRSLDTGIKRLELLLSAGDSGTFFCKGRQENESRTVLQVLGDKADCKISESTHGRSRTRCIGTLSLDTHPAPNVGRSLVEPGS